MAMNAVRVVLAGGLGTSPEDFCWVIPVLRDRVIIYILELLRKRDFLTSMKLNSMSLMTWFSVLISCFLWIGGVSWLAVHFLGLSPEAGWAVVGILITLAVVAAFVISYEVRHAIDLPEDDDSEGGMCRPVSASRLSFSSVAPRPIEPAPAFRTMRERY